MNKKTYFGFASCQAMPLPPVIANGDDAPEKAAMAASAKQDSAIMAILVRVDFIFASQNLYSILPFLFLIVSIEAPAKYPAIAN
jgi:hypothetical protein